MTCAPIWRKRWLHSTPDRSFQPLQRKTVLATPNYGYEKRQRELAKKKKKEEKLRAKASGKPHDGSDVPEAPTEQTPDSGQNAAPGGEGRG